MRRADQVVGMRNLNSGAKCNQCETNDPEEETSTSDPARWRLRPEHNA